MSVTKDCCMYCMNSDTLRTKNGNIRCVKYSMWVDPKACSCDGYENSYINKLLEELLGIKKIEKET